MAETDRNHLHDLRGVSRLAIDATRGVTDLVEAMHHTIAGMPFLFGPVKGERTGGLTGLIYRSIRGVTGLWGTGIDAALGGLAPLLAQAGSRPEVEPVLAVINGVLGDYLAATGNPLAIPMRLRRDGRPLPLEREALRAALPRATGKVLVLVHGSSMSDLQWTRQGHDHGAALERDLGCTAVHLHYNSGLHISTNGRAFAELLELLVAQWPVPIEELDIVGHSMGGLVARSACQVAASQGHRWLAFLRKLAFVGTPHHGAPLERSGNWVDTLLGITPYTAPFARLGKIRSAGVTDLRYGSVLDEDWEGRDRFQRRHDARRPVPLPAGVECFAIAASLDPEVTPSATSATGATGVTGATGATGATPAAEPRASKPRESKPREGKPRRGDGLVPIDSALGRHARPELTLAIPELNQRIFAGMGHLDLLSRPEVYQQLSQWFSARNPPGE